MSRSLMSTGGAGKISNSGIQFYEILENFNKLCKSDFQFYGVKEVLEHTVLNL